MKWTDAALSEVARTCQSRKQFETEHGGAYQTARHLGVLDKICAHMESQREDWTEEAILGEAAKYETRAEFRSKCPNGYAAAVRSKILFKLRSIFKASATGMGNHQVYQLVFPDCTYIGLTCSPEKRIEYHLKRGAVSRYLATSGRSMPPMEVLHAGLGPEEATFLEIEEIRLARARGVNLLNTAGGGQLGAFGRVLWTKTKVLKVALEYSSRSAFRAGSPGAFAVAVANGWRDEVCQHMKVFRRNLTPEEIQRIALQYSSRGEFQNRDFSAYGAARRKGIIDRVCAHMARRRARG